MSRLSIAIVLCVALFGLAAYGLVFDPHHEYHYTYTARAQTWMDQEIVTIIKIRIHYINETDSGKHTMKLFVDSFWQRDDQGHAAANPRNWNLAKSFFFTMTPNGLVEFVHFHPEDHEELVILKKAVVSGFSAHVEELEDHEYEAEYHREEVDHQGLHKMRYRVEKVGGKMVVTRQHSSDGRAERYHDKTLHFNENYDIHKVFSNDMIVLKDKSPPTKAREPYPGETIVEHTEEGEFPTLFVMANTTLFLNHKKPKTVAPVKEEKYKFMKKDSIMVTHNVTKTDDAWAAIKFIDANMKCVLKAKKESEDGVSGPIAECMHGLQSAAHNLTDRALRFVGAHYLNVSCGRAKVDKKCMEVRMVMLHVVGSVDSQEAQRVLLWYVLRRPRNQEEIHAAYTHLILMSDPYPAMLAELEKKCFGDNYEKHGSSILEEDQKRACLMLGAMAGKLNDKDPVRAAQLMGHIETWIDKHGEKHGRYRRDVTTDPEEEEGYYAVFNKEEVAQSTVNENTEMTRVVLIEVLGNAGLRQSLPHLIEHAQPNMGTSAWRRAAVHAMRQYDCDESATSILTSALHDDHHEVRVEALDIYNGHPKAYELSPEQEAVVLLRNVTAESLKRSKRDLAEFLCALGFTVETPGVNYVKEVGSKDIGASLGLILRNHMHMAVAPLSGQLKVEVHDEAYAEVHVGFINFKLDILRILLCFKGHIRYDLNVLKNFGLDNPGELITKFDKIIKSVTDPVILAVDAMIELMATIAERGIIGMVRDLIESTIAIDSGVREMASKTTDFRVVAASFKGKPWMNSILSYALRIDNTMMEVQVSYIAFHQAVGNDLLVTLPTATYDIYEALMGIVDAIGNIFQNPLGILSALTNSVTKIRMGIAEAVRAKQRLERAFLSGSIPYFMEAEDLIAMAADTENMLLIINKVIEDTDDLTAGPVGVGPGGGEPDERLLEREVAVELKPRLENMLLLQKQFAETTKFFLESYNAVLGTIQKIKLIHFNLMKFKGKADTIIKLLSGTKNDPAFPQIVLKNCAQDCGNYPITEGGRPEGILVDAAIGLTLPSPGNAVAYNKGDHLQLDFTDAATKQYSLEIYGIKMAGSITPLGTVMCAGASLGTAAKSACFPNSIHIVLRKRDTGKTVDPRPMFRSPAPLPKWKQICNDFKFVLMGITLSAGAIAGAKDDVAHVRERAAEEFAKFKNQEAPPPAKYEFGKTSPQMAAAMAPKLSPILKEQQSLKNILKDNGISAAGTLPELAIELYTVSVMLEMLDLAGEPAVKTVLLNLVDKLIKISTAEGPLTFAENTNPYVLRESLANGSMANAKSNLAKALEENGLNCPNIEPNIDIRFRHYVFQRPDCKRARCGAEIQYKYRRQLLEIDMDLNSCDINDGVKLTIGAEPPVELELPYREFSEEVELDATHFGDDITSTLHVMSGVKDAEHISITLYVVLCSATTNLCVEPIHIVQGMKFGVAPDCATAEVDLLPIRNRFLGLRLKMFVQELAAANLELDYILEAISEVRSVIYDLTRKAIPQACGRAKGEKENMMADGLDFCLKGKIPTKPHEFTIFSVSFHFMAGPVPLVLSISAGASVGVEISGKLCILSMKVIANVKPSFGAKVEGAAALSLGFARAGIKIQGYFIEITLPATATIKFNSFPLDIQGKLDMILVPLTLKLSAFAELFLIVKFVKIVDIVLWQYSMAAIKKTLFTFGTKAKDPAPPKFSAVDVTKPNKDLAVRADAKTVGEAPAKTPAKRKRRETYIEYVEGCSVVQLTGRAPDNPAYILTAFGSDDLSAPSIDFAVGSAPYGEDIKEYREMASSPTMMEEILPGTIPLFFSVRLIDDDGNENIAVCHLDVYDQTPPTGYSYWYPVSSNTKKIKGNLQVYDEKAILQINQHALGFGGGVTGDQVSPWEDFDYNRLDTVNSGQLGTSLEPFADPIEGRLSSEPHQVHGITSDVYHCADLCHLENCVSFDFDLHTTECLVHHTLMSDARPLWISRKFRHYQRLGVAMSWWMEHPDIPNIVNGQLYTVNGYFTNELGYWSYLRGEGTLIDLTPPTFSDGFLGTPSFETFEHIPCGEASIHQQCHDPTDGPNHWLITDAADSKIFFAGNTRGENTLFTKSNNYLSGNWFPWIEAESGIWGYSVKAGLDVCDDAVFDYVDPHAHFLSETMWTNQAVQMGLHLEDDHYYFTMQATNKIVYGGSLVTTVCHSLPIGIDTQAPVCNGITEIVYDQHFNQMVVYYNISDPVSGVVSVAFGLGRTPHDSEIRPFVEIDLSPHNRLYSMISIPYVDLPPGLPVWVKTRAKDGVDLYTPCAATYPIVIDDTDPIAGDLFDGDGTDLEIFKKDVQWQSSNTTLCTQWYDFYDGETGISKYLWSAGTSPGAKDLFADIEVSSREHTKCRDVPLEHMGTYYASIIAFNRGLNQRCIEANTDGFTVDMTPPTTGYVLNGLDPAGSPPFSSKAATFSANWLDFHDPESGIASQSVTVLVNGEETENYTVEPGTNHIEEHTFAHQHRDVIQAKVTVKNAARGESMNISSELLIDLTPPDLVYLRDTPDGRKYTNQGAELKASFSFFDHESDVKEYWLKFFERFGGEDSRKHPTTTTPAYETIVPSETGENNTRPYEKTLAMSLQNGAMYYSEVTACNYAGLCNIKKSEGLIVDFSDPTMTWAYIGAPATEELLDDDLPDGIPTVRTANPEGVLANWRGQDYESKVFRYFVAVGTSVGGTDIVDFVDYGTATSALIPAALPVTADSGQYYWVTVYAENGAGALSERLSSHRFQVLEANKPGSVFDGDVMFVDSDQQYDYTTITASFSGFESEFCGITGYEWGIGNRPGDSDLQALTNAGIVMLNETSGIAQANLDVPKNTFVYVTIAAKTGFNCHEDMIVAQTNGIWCDTTMPSNEINMLGEYSVVEGGLRTDINYYQAADDTMGVIWNTNDFESGYMNSKWIVGCAPGFDDLNPGGTVDFPTEVPLGTITLNDGDTLFATITSRDFVGNENVYVSGALTIDSTPPNIVDFVCRMYLSKNMRIPRCRWAYNNDDESPVHRQHIEIGLAPQESDLWAREELNYYVNHWHMAISENFFTPGTTYFATLTSYNSHNLTSYAWSRMRYDPTPPTPGEVHIVTTSIPGHVSPESVLCQESMSHTMVQWTPYGEDHSDMERYEVSIGYGDNPTAVRDFHPVELRENELINAAEGVHIATVYHSPVPPGTVLYAYVRGYNNAGEYSSVRSHDVVVSPKPEITIWDSYTGKNARYTQDETVYQAKWFPSDSCPLVNVTWRILRLDESEPDIRTWISADVDNDILYVDSIEMLVDETYFSEIYAVDAIGRVIMAQSDGVQVYLTTPSPAGVWIGTTEPEVGYFYAEPTEYISCAWNPFGDPSGIEPGQTIWYYLVGIGTDPSIEFGWSNVVYFVNVSTDTSYTFTELNLTPKTVAYYCTVKAVSQAESYTYQTSNAIFVGFRDEMNASPLFVDVYVSNNVSLSVAWDRCDSDFPITENFIAISDHPIAINHSLSCEENLEGEEFTVLPMTSNGVDTMLDLEGLDMLHGADYWVILQCKDWAAHCALNISEPVRVDLTPPLGGFITGGKIVGDVTFVSDDTSMLVTWGEFEDPESGIESYRIGLYKMPDCISEDYSQMELVAGVNTILTADTNNTYLTFDGQQLTAETPYYLGIVTQNHAGLTSTVWSMPTFVDVTAPHGGAFKDGPSFEHDQIYTNVTDELYATLTFVHTPDNSYCATTKNVSFKGEIPEDWVEIDPFERKKRKNKKENYLKYTKEMLVESDKGLIIQMKHNQRKKLMQGGMVIGKPEPLYVGTYTTYLQAVNGQNIITGVEYVAFGTEVPELNFGYPVVDDLLSESDFDDAEGFGGNATDAADDPTETRRKRQAEDGATTVPPEATTEDTNITTTTEPYDKYKDPTYVPEVDIQAHCAFGYEIIGHLEYSPNGEANASFLLFWVRVDDSDYLTRHTWIELPFDPTLEVHEYTIKVEFVVSGFMSLYDLSMVVDGTALASFNQLDIGSKEYFPLVKVWNNQEFIPSIKDQGPFKPFESQGLLELMILPLPRDQLCHFGKPFYDYESAIDEIWVGVGSNNTFDANIVDMFLYSKSCVRCYDVCDHYSCDDNCTDTNIRDLLQIHLPNLTLSEGELGVRQDAEGEDEEFMNTATYYVMVKIFNRANLSTISWTDGITIDLTPPVKLKVECMDPWFSMDQPSEQQGANDSLGAQFEFKDDESNIQYYEVAAATMDEESGNLTYINNFTKVRSHLDKYIIKDLSLEQDQRYFFIVVAVGGSHLKTTGWCNITVNMVPPNLDVNEAVPDGTNEELAEQFPEGVHATEETKKVGISWPAEDLEECDLIEWQLSSNDKKEQGDLVPLTTIGTGGTVEGVQIQLGNLIVTINGQMQVVGLGEFASNLDWLALNETQRQEQIENKGFQIEFGKCVRHELYCVNKANLKQLLKPTKVCQRRKEDKTKGLAKGKKGSLSGNSAGNSRRRKKRQDQPIEFDIPASPEDAALSFGALSETDLNEIFESASAPDYRPYVVNPNETIHMTSRLMWARVKDIVGVNFYLSPAADMWLEASIVVEFSADYEVDAGQEVALLYWDWGVQQWTHSSESCDKNPILQNDMLQTEICQTLTFGEDEVLEPPTPAAYPVTSTMYSVVVQLDTPQNDPPELITEYFDMLEDEELTVQLRHYDTANDQVKWYLAETPSQGHATVSEEGILYYQPVRDRFGTDMLHIKMVEYGLPSVMTPLETVANITISIEPMNDEPYLLVIYNHGEQIVFRKDETDLIQENSIIIENREMQLFGNKAIALVVLFDPDENAEMEILFQVYDPVTGEYKDVSPDDFVLDIFNTSLPFVNKMLLDLVYPQLTWFMPTTPKAWLVSSEFDSGIHAFRIMGKDETDRYTTQFKLNAAIMQNPCYHGYCAGPEDDFNCTDTRRSESFDGYRCECYEGYSGETCDKGCDCVGTFEDCVTHVECNNWGVCEEKSYDCVLNITNLVGVAGGGAAFIILLMASVIAGLCYKFMPRVQTKQKDTAQYSDSDPNEFFSTSKRPYMFNFFGSAYSKGDPLQQGTQGFDNPGFTPNAGEGNIDKPQRAVYDNAAEDAIPWYRSIMSPTYWKSNLWRDAGSNGPAYEYAREDVDLPAAPRLPRADTLGPQLSQGGKRLLRS